MIYSIYFFGFYFYFQTFSFSDTHSQTASFCDTKKNLCWFSFCFAKTKNPKRNILSIAFARFIGH